MKRAGWLVCATLVIVVLTAASVLFALRLETGRFVDSDQVQVEARPGVTIAPGQSVGQTFVAQHGGLNGLEVHLNPSPDATGAVVLHLRDNPFTSTDILTARSHVAAGSEEGFVRFSFPPVLSSHTRYYYALFEFPGTGQLEAAQGSLSSYPDGTLYIDHEPRDAQMVFRLSYDPVSVVRDLLFMVAGWVGYGVAGLGILFFSGYWLVCRWAREVRLDFTASLVASAIAALAAWMVLVVWASLFVTLNALTVRLIVGASCILGVIQFAKDRERWRTKQYWLGESPLSTLALWSVILLTIALRLFVGRGMVMLPGGDTYHHTLIVKLFEEQGGIPRSYQPYAPLISFSYHFGFHSIVALFRWLFGTDLLLTTKTVALVLNGAVAATVGLVAERWAGNRRAGVIASAFAGLIMVSPFGLLRWGRYTQATGLLFLAAALLALTAAGEGGGWLYPSLLVAGLVLSHYRVASLWMLYVALAAAAKALQRRWIDLRDWLVIGAVSLVLVAPWLVRVAWVQYDSLGLRALSPVLEGVGDLRRLETPVLRYVTNWPVLALSVLSAAVVWWGDRTKDMSRPLVTWYIVMIAWALGVSVLGVNSFLDPITTLLSLAVPISILAGLAGEILWSETDGPVRTVARTGVTVLLLSGMAVGVLRLPRMFREQSFHLLRPADLVAMKWTSESVPEDSLFLVDAVELDWSPGWIVGIDSGYVIPLLAHRMTTVPPMIYPLEWADATQLGAVLQASREFLSRGEDGASALVDILEKHGVTHVFVGARRLSLNPTELAQEARLREIYHQDWVWVFELVD